MSVPAGTQPRTLLRRALVTCGVVVILAAIAHRVFFPAQSDAALAILVGIAGLASVNVGVRVPVGSRPDTEALSRALAFGAQLGALVNKRTDQGQPNGPSSAPVTPSDPKAGLPQPWGHFGRSFYSLSPA